MNILHYIALDVYEFLWYRLGGLRGEKDDDHFFFGTLITNVDLDDEKRHGFYYY